MTTALALQYIPRRMNELGYGDNYVLRFRHLVLEPEQTMTLEAENQLFILVEQVSDASINSDMGIYDLTDPALNEQSYEHQGKITIQNYSPQHLHLRMIQVIPNNNEKCQSTSNTSTKPK